MTDAGAVHEGGRSITKEAPLEGSAAPTIKSLMAAASRPHLLVMGGEMVENGASDLLEMWVPHHLGLYMLALT